MDVLRLPTKPSTQAHLEHILAEEQKINVDELVEYCDFTGENRHTLACRIR